MVAASATQAATAAFSVPLVRNLLDGAIVGNNHYRGNNLLQSLSSSFSSSGGGGGVCPWSVALAIGFVLGTTASNQHAYLPLLAWLDRFAANYLVPGYTAAVLLYLTGTAFRKEIKSVTKWVLAFGRKQFRSIRERRQRRRRCQQLAVVVPPVPNNALQQEQQPQQFASAAAVGPLAGSSSPLFIAPPTQQNVEEAQRQLVLPAHQPINLSGAYKLISNHNFEKFLEVQGVPWALRRAANQVRPVHRITHEGRKLTIKIEGIIESQTTYWIDGPPVETVVRGRVFRDRCTYLQQKRQKREEEDGDEEGEGEVEGIGGGGGIKKTNKKAILGGIIMHKDALEENYRVTVKRELTDDLQQIIMTSTAYFDSEEQQQQQRAAASVVVAEAAATAATTTRDPVQAVQVFQRTE